MPKNKKPYAKGRKACIFCGNYGVTKEHIWTKPMRKYFPDMLGTEYVHITTKCNEDGSTIRNRGALHKRSPDGHALRVVCADCNNGWMSQLQQLSWPALEPLVSGDWSNLDPVAVNRIANLVVLMTMVLDQADQNSVGVSSQDRAHFKLTRRPPKGWFVRKLWDTNSTI